MRRRLGTVMLATLVLVTGGPLVVPGLAQDSLQDLVDAAEPGSTVEVPAGTPGKVILANGFNWQRYRVLFDNGGELGDLDHRHLEPTGRTAKRLLEMAGEEDEFELPLTQEELAGMVGASRERVNKSINQTLPRTVLTSVTTLIALISLFLFGGDIIHNFSIALILGVLIGTYSSIFIDSPTVLLLGVSRENLLPVKKEGEGADAGAGSAP